MIGDNKKNKKKQKGVTLIEILVAITIFAIIVGVNVNMFINALNAQRRAFEVQNVIDSTRYTLEIITKELRSMDVRATMDAVSGCTYSACMNADGDYSDIYFVSGSKNRYLKVLRFYQSSDTIMFVDDVVGGSSAGLITASNISIVSFNMKVDNIAISGQPKITITIEAEAKNSKFNSPSVKLQTTISPRQLNIL